MGANLRLTINKMATYSLGFGLFVSWLYLFPMFGPLLDKVSLGNGSHLTELFLLFVGFHGLGLLAYGKYFSYVVSLHKRSKIQIMQRSMITFIGWSAVLTLCFAILPAMFLPWVMAGLGLAAAPIMILYQVYVSEYFPTLTMGKKIGLALFLAELIYILFTFYDNDFGTIWLFILAVMLLFLSLWLFQTGLRHSVASTSTLQQITTKMVNKRGYMIKLLIMVFFWYLVTGFMYSLAYPSWFGNVSYSLCVENASYMVAALLAGYFADRYVRKHMLFISLSLSGIGYLILYAFRGHAEAVFAICLLQFGSAFLDLYLFTTLAEIASQDPHPSSIWGEGLFINLFAIFVANGLFFAGHEAGWLLSGLKLAGIMIIFLLIPISNAVIKPNLWGVRQNDRSQNESSDPSKGEKADDLEGLFHHYHLTPREAQVAQLILKGHTMSEIEQELHIKVTTIKTHLKGIYNKTGTNNQKDFILFVHHYLQE